jgi:hypothetical protein
MLTSEPIPSMCFATSEYREIAAHDGPSALRLLERQPAVHLFFTDGFAGWHGSPPALVRFVRR